MLIALVFDCHLFFLKSNVFARKGVFTLNADSLFLQYCLFFAVLHFCKKEEKVVIHCKILPKIHLMECHTLFTQKDNLFVKKALDSKHYQKERLHLCIIIVLYFILMLSYCNHIMIKAHQRLSVVSSSIFFLW